MSTEDAWYMADKLREVLQSKNFAKDDFDTRSLKLSQAFCLLWQEQETGEVHGRQRAGKASNAAAVAVLLDLFMLGKIEFEALVKQWTSMNRRREIIFVKVVDASPTGTFLDKALFTAILSHHASKPTDPKTIQEWIIQGSCMHPTSATEVLESLVEAKILGKTSKLFWKKYPTINSEPKKKLVNEIRRIALMGHIADGYMWTLIKLLCNTDDNTFSKSSILSRHFSAEESVKAKALFASLVCVENELHIDARPLEACELQELRGPDEKKQEEEEQVTSDEAGASCTLHDVTLVDKEELSSSVSVEEPENSQLLRDKENSHDKQ